MEKSKIVVCVYTIALNEERFALRWARSTIEADYRIVGDTGSTDNTISILQSEGVTVHSISVKPWRFDKARNVVMDLVPSDVVWFISLDMDEVLVKGWRNSFDETVKNNPDLTFVNCKFKSYFARKHQITNHWHERIHVRGYRWINPVHETPVYQYKNDPTIEWCEGVTMEQHPDESKDRTSYIGLLEFTVLIDEQQRHRYSSPVIPNTLIDTTLVRLNPVHWKLWYFLTEERYKIATNQELGGSRNLVGALIAGWYSQSIEGVWKDCSDEMIKFYIKPAIEKIITKDIENWLNVCNPEYPWLLRYPEGLSSIGLESSYIKNNLQKSIIKLDAHQLNEKAQTVYSILKECKREGCAETMYQKISTIVSVMKLDLKIGQCK